MLGLCPALQAKPPFVAALGLIPQQSHQGGRADCFPIPNLTLGGPAYRRCVVYLPHLGLYVKRAQVYPTSLQVVTQFVSGTYLVRTSYSSPTTLFPVWMKLTSF